VHRRRQSLAPEPARELERHQRPEAVTEEREAAIQVRQHTFHQQRQEPIHAAQRLFSEAPFAARQPDRA